MAEKVLKAQRREGKGSNSSKRVRKDGFTPVVLYGKHFESTGLKIETNELKRFLNNSELGAMVVIDIDGQKETALVKEVQRQTVRREILHVDFQHIKFGEKIKVTLPIHLVNTEKVNHELIIQKLVDFVEVEAFPKDLVEFIEVDVENLEIGTPVTIADIDTKKYAGLEILGEEDTTIAVLIEPSPEEPSDEEKAAMEAAAAEAAAEAAAKAKEEE